MKTETIEANHLFISGYFFFFFAVVSDSLHKALFPKRSVLRVHTDTQTRTNRKGLQGVYKISALVT